MSASHSILIYCGDVLGLGHLRRNTAIASRLVQELPGTNALLMTSLPTSCVFDCPSGVDVVKLPSLSKDARGEIGARTLSVQQTQLKRVRSMMIEGLTRSFRPDMMLVDHLPVGVWGELQPTLDRFRAEPDRPLTVLGLRDIIDEPRKTRQRWLESRVYPAIEQRYDAVMIYGSRQVFDTARHYGLDNGTVTRDVQHCGYVCSEQQLVRSRPSRRELGLDDRRLVVITAGGGADGHPMMRLGLQALRRLRERTDLQVVCITGPFMDREQIADLRALAAELPAEVLWCVDRAPAYFQAADLILTMAGYNTLIEATRLGKRTVVVPRRGPSAEQSMRAELFQQRGLVHMLPLGASEETLAQLLATTLAAPPPWQRLPEMDGLDHVTSRLRRMLEARAGGTRLPRVEGRR